MSWVFGIQYKIPEYSALWCSIKRYSGVVTCRSSSLEKAIQKYIKLTEPSQMKRKLKRRLTIFVVYRLQSLWLPGILIILSRRCNPFYILFFYIIFSTRLTIFHVLVYTNGSIQTRGSSWAPKFKIGPKAITLCMFNLKMGEN